MLSLDDSASVLEVVQLDEGHSTPRVEVVVRYDATHVVLSTMCEGPGEARARLEVFRANDLVAALDWAVETAVRARAYLAAQQHPWGWQAEVIWLERFERAS